MKLYIYLYFILQLFVSCKSPSKEKFNRNLFDKQLTARVQVYATSSLRGSGTLIDDYVLTNYHVIKKYDNLENYLIFSSQDTISFTIVFIDSLTDLALIKPNRVPIIHSLNINEIISRNKQPDVGDIFNGVGYPKGKLKSITSFFKTTKKVNTFQVSTEIAQSENTLEQAYTLIKNDTLDYHGASGTLMFSYNSCGILTGVNDKIFALVGNKDIIYFLKKSGYF